MFFGTPHESLDVMKIEIRKLTHSDIDDFLDLVRVFHLVFEGEYGGLPDPVQLKKVLGMQSFIAFVASLDQQVVGGLTVHVLERYDAHGPSAYLYDLAVLPSFQRQGIGSLLIRHLNEYCIDNGFSEVFVQAECVDAHAVAFYRSTAIYEEMQTMHFTYRCDK